MTRGIFFFALLTTACSSRAAPSGINEPLRVQGGQFVNGALPRGETGPKIVTVESNNNAVPQGFIGKKLEGNVGRGASSIAIGLEGLGSGYWLMPVGFPDPLSDGELRWEVLFDVASTAPVGKRALLLTAIDAEGRPGPLYTQAFEVLPQIPSGKMVITLRWDSDADLDLVVVAPTGKTLDPKRPTTVLQPDAGVDAAAPEYGFIDRDSNAACVRDSYRQEDLIHPTSYTPGVWDVRVSMFSGCGAAAANYTVTITVDGQKRGEKSGRLLEAFDVGQPPIAVLKLPL